MNINVRNVEILKAVGLSIHSWTPALSASCVCHLPAWTSFVPALILQICCLFIWNSSSFVLATPFLFRSRSKCVWTALVQPAHRCCCLIDIFFSSSTSANVFLCFRIFLSIDLLLLPKINFSILRQTAKQLAMLRCLEWACHPVLFCWPDRICSASGHCTGGGAQSPAVSEVQICSFVLLCPYPWHLAHETCYL